MSVINKFKTTLATYKKRDGTSDRGKEYEWLQCAFYALKFATNDDVIDFEMFTNNEFFGDFDDVALRVRFKDGSLMVFLIQLKLSERKKTLTLNALTAENGDFSLFKYLKSYNNILGSNSFKFILYTNRSANFKNDTELTFGEEKIRVKHQECVAKRFLDSNLTRNRSVFKFEGTGHGFFDQFYLFVNQQNDISLKDSISSLLKTCLKCDVYKPFVDFMRSWWAGNFKLTKYDVIAKLTELVFSPMVQTLSGEKCNEKTELIKEAILKSDLTIVENEDGITKIWKEVSAPRNIKETSLTALKYGLTTKGINRMDELSPETKAKVLWYLNETPLIVEIEDSKNEEILATIKLLERCKERKKVILIGAICQDNLSNWKIFRDLSDISLFEDLRLKIAKNLHCQLQGKKSINLEELGAYNSAITKVFSVKYLLRIAISDCYNIGEDLEKLPSTYIPRLIPKILLNYSAIDDLHETTIFLSCNQHLKEVQRKIRKRIMNITCNLAGVENASKHYIYGTDAEFTEEKLKKEISGFYYHFRVIEPSLLQWLNSPKHFDKLEPYRKTNATEFAGESEIDNHFHNRIRILTSHTGGGKTTFLNRLKNESPPNRFIVKINLKEHSQFFKSQLEPNRVWDYLVDYTAKNRGYDSLAESLLRNFDKARIVVLWDAFDELHQDSKKFFVKSVTKLRSVGVTQWVATKNNFQKALESEFNVFATTMLPFRQDEQTCYIRERSGVRDSATMDEFFKNVNIATDTEYLGVPLQLYILTDIFNHNPESLKSVLTLTDMCGEFVEGRYAHFLKKTNCDVDFLGDLIENSKDYRLQQYKIAALQTHMPDLFQTLKLEVSSKFIEDVRRGDFLGLVVKVDEDGCITFEHRIFGEYFSALWCSEHCHEAKPFLYQANYRTIKFMFDLLLAEKRPIFIQILYKKFENLDELQIVKDRAGRSPLQVLCTYGQRHPLLNTESCDDTFLVEADRADSVQVDGEGIKNAVRYLKTVCDPFEKDDLFGWSSYDYADQSQALGMLEVLGGGLDTILPNLSNYKDLPSVLFYSTKLNYTNLFKAIIEIPYIENHGRGNLLHVAAENNRETLLASLLSDGKYFRSINKSNKDHWTPIHFASFNGNLNVLKFLKCKGGTFRYQEPSVMSLAATHGYQQIVEFLIECNMSPNDFYHMNYFTQSFALSISGGYVEIVKFLVNNGAQLYKIGKNATNALHMALENEQLEIAEFLLEKGIKIDEVDDNGRNSYHHAAMNNQKSVILFLLKRNANFNVTDDTGRTPLHYAAQNGSLEIAEILLTHKIDVNAPDNDGFIPLHLAVQYGQEAIVKVLIEAGAMLDAPNKYKRTPMHLAAFYGLPDCIEILASAGASLENEDTLYARRALHYAAWQDHEDCVQVLIRRGAQIAPPCHFRYTPLHLAAEMQSFECCQLLIEAGAPIFAQNANETTPFDMVYSGNYALSVLFLEHFPYPLHQTVIPETIPELVARGIDVNGLDDSGETPLHAAVRNRFVPNMVEALINKGADIKSRDQDGYIPLQCALQLPFQFEKTIKMLLNADFENETLRMKTKTGATALHVAIQKERRYIVSESIVQLLLDKGAEINACDNNGFIPLHYACQNGNIDVVKLLVSRGAEVNRPNNQRRGALHMAAISGSSSIVEYLLEEGALVDVEDIDGDSPLDDALNAEHPQVFKVLLTKTSTSEVIDRRNCKGRTVLHMAAKQGSLDLVQFFLDKKLSVDVVDNFGNTPLDDALFNKHHEIFNLLLQHSKSFDINKYSQHYKCCPLHIATTPELLDSFLKKGAAVDVVDCDGNSPLHLAALADRKEVLKLLLDSDFEAKAVNIANKRGQTPLHIVMKEHSHEEELVKLLVEKGARIDIEDEDGNIPFDIEFRNKGHLMYKDYLLFGLKNYDINKYNEEIGTTLLHYAAKGDFKLANWLLERGASVNLVDCSGDSPLHVACKYSAEMAEFFLEKFRDIIDLAKTNCDGETVLHCAVDGFDLKLELIKLLVESGAPVDAVTKSGETALDLALENENADCFRFLMGKASNVNVTRVHTARTPLHMAASTGALDLVKMFLQNGFKVNEADKHGMTPMHDAFENNHLEILKLLLDLDKYGTTINIANYSGQTWLHTAAEQGNLDMVKLLLEKGAKIDLFDGLGETARDLAMKNEHMEVYQFLSQRMESMKA